MNSLLIVFAILAMIIGIVLLITDRPVFGIILIVFGFIISVYSAGFLDIAHSQDPSPYVAGYNDGYEDGYKDFADFIYNGTDDIGVNTIRDYYKNYTDFNIEEDLDNGIIQEIIANYLKAFEDNH